MFGGFSGGGAGGTTIVQRNLDRITVFASLTFAFTTVWLTFLWR